MATVKAGAECQPRRGSVVERLMLRASAFGTKEHRQFAYGLCGYCRRPSARQLTVTESARHQRAHERSMSEGSFQPRCDGEQRHLLDRPVIAPLRGVLPARAAATLLTVEPKALGLPLMAKPSQGYVLYPRAMARKPQSCHYLPEVRELGATVRKPQSCHYVEHYLRSPLQNAKMHNFSPSSRHVTLSLKSPRRG